MASIATLPRTIWVRIYREQGYPQNMPSYCVQQAFLERADVETHASQLSRQRATLRHHRDSTQIMQVTLWEDMCQWEQSEDAILERASSRTGLPEDEE